MHCEKTSPKVNISTEDIGCFAFDTDFISYNNKPSHYGEPIIDELSKDKCCYTLSFLYIG